jgi:aminoglycoside N3'-acetyltransferase
VTSPSLTAGALIDDLRRLGVRRGDTLMIHASFRAIGPLPGGPEALLDALEDAVGSDGTLLMILGADIEHDWVNRLPEAERLPLLAEVPPFDPATAPVFHEVGHFAEIFRRRGGTRVTDNPSGRFGARGRLAHDLLADAPWHDYYGPGSPLDRFCQIGGRVLRIGANLDTTTVLHFAEYCADVSNKRRVRRHYRCHGPHGPETRAVECLDDEHGIVDWPGEDYFATILREYLATGPAKQGMVGRARSELLQAGDLVQIGTAWMTVRFRDFRHPSP